MKFADPRNDVAFKKIFGDENKKEILMSFLNNILEFVGTDKEIVSIDIQDPYQVPKLDGLKYSILDIKAVDKRDIHYIIEMQLFHTRAFEKRVLYYTSKAYCQQLGKGEEYPRLNQVIFLGFLDFNLFKETDHYSTRHLILEENTNGHYLQDFEFNFIELPKFNKSLEELEDVKDKWIFFVKNAGNMTMVPKSLEEPYELAEAFDVANKMSWSKEELDAYDTKGMHIQDERGRVEYALDKGKQIGLEEGEKKGMEKGKKIGLEEGEKIGIEKGRKEQSIQVARKLISKGIDMQIIADTTALSLQEIEKLAMEN